jgi:hypothetical protein
MLEQATLAQAILNVCTTVGHVGRVVSEFSVELTTFSHCLAI